MSTVSSSLHTEPGKVVWRNEAEPSQVALSVPPNDLLWSQEGGTSPLPGIKLEMPE